MNDSILTKGAPLARRRRILAARRAACALCAGLLAWALVGAIATRGQTTTVMVASRAIVRGETLADGMLATARVPAGAVAAHAWSADRQGALPGLVAQTDIEEGEPIMAGMVSDAPLASDGLTLIDVPLASSPSQLIPGQSVTLIAAGPCDGEGAAPSCVLASGALVTALPQGEAFSSDAVTLALRPDDALAVIACAQSGTPIIAAANG